MRVKIWASMTPWTCFYLSLEGPFSRGDPRWTTPASVHALLGLPLTLGSPMACFWPMQQKRLPNSWDFVIRSLMASGRSHLPSWWPCCEEAKCPSGGLTGPWVSTQLGAQCVSEAPSSMSSPVEPSDDSNSSHRKFRLQLCERSTIKIPQQIHSTHET